MGSREKVLEAAQEIFFKQGYQASSIDQILGAARVSPSNFYYHFKGKEELALEAIERYMARIREETQSIWALSTNSHRQKLEALHRYFIEWMEKNDCCGGCPIGNLAQELSDTHPSFRERLSGYFRLSIDNITGLIQEGIQLGEFRKDIDPRSVAYMVFGSMEGLLLLAKSLKEIEPLERGFQAILMSLTEVQS